jgi:hypothetical protein
VPEVVAAGGTVIDNDSSQFKALGLWPTLSSPAGFEGSDYRARNKAADGFGTEIIVDDGDATGFTVTGNWAVDTGGPIYNGTHRVKGKQSLPPEAIIIDNVDAGFEVFGTWSTSTNGQSGSE